MIVRFAQWGNSLALRVPAKIARDIGAADGVSAEITVDAGHLVVAPLAPKPRYVLADLLAGITEENCHDEISSGEPVGREFW